MEEHRRQSAIACPNEDQRLASRSEDERSVVHLLDELLRREVPEQRCKRGRRHILGGLPRPADEPSRAGETAPPGRSQPVRTRYASWSSRLARTHNSSL